MSKILNFECFSFNGGDMLKRIHLYNNFLSNIAVWIILNLSFGEEKILLQTWQQSLCQPSAQMSFKWGLVNSQYFTIIFDDCIHQVMHNFLCVYWEMCSCKCNLLGVASKVGWSWSSGSGERDKYETTWMYLYYQVPGCCKSEQSFPCILLSFSSLLPANSQKLFLTEVYTDYWQ